MRDFHERKRSAQHATAFALVVELGVSDATAADIVDLALRAKPELIVHRGSLPDTAETVRDLLAASGRLFDRGLPVRVVRPADGGPPSAIPLTRHNVVMETHRLCQPMQKDSRATLFL